MGKIRRGDYLFITWVGDHPPRHVHIIRNSKTLAKWNLERGCLIEGRVSRKVLKILQSLIDEGKL